MTALFTTNQIGKDPGELDKARRDISIGTITVDCPSAHATYLWEIVSAPIGSTASVLNPTLATTDMDLTITGGHLIQLTVDKDEPTEDISVRYIGIPMAGSGLCIPAAWETLFDNSQSPFDGLRGAEDKLTALYKWIDAGGSGGGGLFEAGTGTNSTQRTDVGLDAAADYSYANGLNNVIEDGSDYSMALMGGPSGEGDDFNVIGASDASPYSFAAGRDIFIDDQFSGENYGHNFAFGWGLTIDGAYNTVYGEGNTANDCAHTLVVGDGCELEHITFGFALGSECTTDENSPGLEYAFLMGNSCGIIGALGYQFMFGDEVRCWGDDGEGRHPVDSYNFGFGADLEFRDTTKHSVMFGEGNSISEVPTEWDHHFCMVWGLENDLSIRTDADEIPGLTLVWGYGNVVHTNSSFVWGGENEVDAYNDPGELLNDYCFVFGDRNTVELGCPYSTVSGFDHIIQEETQHCTLFGQDHEVGSESHFSTLFGFDHMIEDNIIHATIFGFVNEIMGESTYCTIIGKFNTIDDESSYSFVVGGGEEDFENEIGSGYTTPYTFCFGYGNIIDGYSVGAAEGENIIFGTHCEIQGNNMFVVAKETLAENSNACIAFGAEHEFHSINGSVAIGMFNQFYEAADGYSGGHNSFAGGAAHEIWGIYDFAYGELHDVYGDYSAALGYHHIVRGDRSMAVGDETIIHDRCQYAVSFGSLNEIGTPMPAGGADMNQDHMCAYGLDNTVYGHNGEGHTSLYGEHNGAWARFGYVNGKFNSIGASLYDFVVGRDNEVGAAMQVLDIVGGKTVWMSQHTTGEGVATLVDSTMDWSDDQWIGYYVWNLTQDARGEITDSDQTTITAVLITEGSADWKVGDFYIVTDGSVGTTYNSVFGYNNRVLGHHNFVKGSNNIVNGYAAHIAVFGEANIVQDTDGALIAGAYHGYPGGTIDDANYCLITGGDGDSGGGHNVRHCDACNVYGEDNEVVNSQRTLVGGTGSDVETTFDSVCIGEDIETSRCYESLIGGIGTRLFYNKGVQQSYSSVVWGDGHQVVGSWDAQVHACAVFGLNHVVWASKYSLIAGSEHHDGEPILWGIGAFPSCGNFLSGEYNYNYLVPSGVSLREKGASALIGSSNVNFSEVGFVQGFNNRIGGSTNTYLNTVFGEGNVLGIPFENLEVGTSGDIKIISACTNSTPSAVTMEDDSLGDNWVVNQWAGWWIVNIKDGNSYGQVVSNTIDTITVTSLTGGDNNNFEEDDAYYLTNEIVPAAMQRKCTNASPSTTTMEDDALGDDWTINEWQNWYIVNLTDGGSYGQIVSNTIDTITVGSLTGGDNNNFEEDDVYYLIEELDSAAMQHNYVFGKDNTIDPGSSGGTFNTLFGQDIELQGPVEHNVAGGLLHTLIDTVAYNAVFGKQNGLEDTYCSLVAGEHQWVNGGWNLAVGKGHDLNSINHVAVLGLYGEGRWYGSIVNSGNTLAYDGVPDPDVSNQYPGQSQNVVDIPFSGVTEDAVMTEIFPDGLGADRLGGTEVLPVLDNESITGSVSIVGRKRGDTQTRSWDITFLVGKAGSATTTLINSTKTLIGTTATGNEASWDCQVSVDTADDTIQVEVQGYGSEVIYWEASMRVAQVCTTRDYQAA